MKCCGKNKVEPSQRRTPFHICNIDRRMVRRGGPIGRSLRDRDDFLRRLTSLSNPFPPEFN
jgi:hypothetical protein